VPVRSALQPLIFGAPEIGDAEIQGVTACLRSAWIGTGPRVDEFEREFARYKDVPYAAAVSSGTAALHLALLALGIGPGDEVIAPTMTFCSTIHSIIHTGATPVLVDCRPDTLNIDPEKIERCITQRSRAIVVVHMGGRCCAMDAIVDIARRHGLRLIEDCAHALESVYRRQPAGTLGDAGCFSFYPTKSVTTGDGGMVIASDKRIHKRIKILSMQGMTSNAWTRPASGRHNRVVAAGFKYNMTDISAALGSAQLPQVARRWAVRRQLWQSYNKGLQGLPMTLPAEPEPDTEHACHLYSVALQTEELWLTRSGFLDALRAENIGAGVHFEPVHRQPYYRRRFGFRATDFPVATRLGERTVSLPLSSVMDTGDVADVCRAMHRISRYFDRRQSSVPPRAQGGELVYALPQR